MISASIHMNINHGSHFQMFHGFVLCFNHAFVFIKVKRVLAMLKVESNISANRICQVIGLDKAAVSRALKQLLAHKQVNAYAPQV